MSQTACLDSWQSIVQCASRYNVMCGRAEMSYMGGPTTMADSGYCAVLRRSATRGPRQQQSVPALPPRQIAAGDADGSRDRRRFLSTRVWTYQMTRRSATCHTVPHLYGGCDMPL